MRFSVFPPIYRHYFMYTRSFEQYTPLTRNTKHYFTGTDYFSQETRSYTPVILSVVLPRQHPFFRILIQTSELRGTEMHVYLCAYRGVRVSDPKRFHVY